jgi:hypothetical protein
MIFWLIDATLILIVGAGMILTLAMSRDVPLLGFAVVRAGEVQALRARLAAAEAPTSPAATAAADSGPAEPGRPADGPPAVVQEAIRLADGLIDLSGSSELPAGTVLRWVEVRTEDLLTACDVRRIEESGTFDPRRHKAEDTQEAPSPELADQIASTVRPGYAWHGAVLRPQQVIVYVPSNRKAEE